MIFTKPIPFTDALRILKAKQNLPMTLDSAGYRKLGGDLLRRSKFAAEVTNAGFLDELHGLLTRVVEGATPESEAARAAGTDTVLQDIPGMRLKLQEYLDKISYKPAKAEDEGTIKDLRTDARLNVMVDTNVNTTLGYGQFKASQNEVTLDLFPAQELFRLVQPKTTERKWIERWKQVGGKFYGDQRMIALKDDPIWQALGDPANFDDALGNPYAPFAWGSGMELRDIAREEAIAIGVMTEETVVQPQDLGINDDLQSNVSGFAKALQSSLARNPDVEMDNGFLRLKAA